MLTECRPGGACSVQGVVHAIAGLPSSVAVAPPGLLTTITSCAATRRTCGCDGCGDTGCGAVSCLGGSSIARFGAGSPGGVAPCGGPIGLGFASPGGVELAWGAGGGCGCECGRGSWGWRRAAS